MQEVNPSIKRQRDGELSAPQRYPIHTAFETLQWLVNLQFNAIDGRHGGAAVELMPESRVRS